MVTFDGKDPIRSKRAWSCYFNYCLINISLCSICDEEIRARKQQTYQFVSKKGVQKCINWLRKTQRDHK